MNTLLTLSGEYTLVPLLDNGQPNHDALIHTASEMLRCPAYRISLTDVGNDTFMALAQECHVRSSFRPVESWMKWFDANGDCEVASYFIPLSNPDQMDRDAIYTALLHIDDLPAIPFHFVHYRNQFTRVRTSEFEKVRPSNWSNDVNIYVRETPETQWFDSLEACLRHDLRVDEYDTEVEWLHTGNYTELTMEPAIDEWLTQCSARFRHEANMYEVWLLQYDNAPLNPAHQWMSDLVQSLDVTYNH
jgi:hypothetical protein